MRLLFILTIYYGIYGEYNDEDLIKIDSNRYVPTSKKILTVDKGYNEWNRYTGGRGEKLDFRGDYIIWESSVKVKDDRKIEWRYLVEEDGKETIYTPAL